MTSNAPSPLVLPALKGIMGDWVYYSCLMTMDQLSLRVGYARDIHQHKGLSDMLQRELDEGERGEEIAKYLETRPERFFNSLVVATYGGNPTWHALRDLRIGDNVHELQDIDQSIVESVGFLTLTGEEKVFALDGQHRLAGIKKVMEKTSTIGVEDEVSVIVVAHHRNSEGTIRTRRLFTTLNKKAVAVSKGDIIILDEDDVMAICVRRLVEETEFFSGKKLAFVASNNMPPTNEDSWTTVGSLYDSLAILFSNSDSDLKREKAHLQENRPDNEVLDRYFAYAREYLTALAQHFPELEEFFGAKNAKRVVRKYRGEHGGSVLFRPIGLQIFTTIIGRLSFRMPLDDAIASMSLLPRQLNEPPYVGLMWDKSARTIKTGHNVTLREILYYMLGGNSRFYSEADLLRRYRRALGEEDALLPARLVTA